MENSIYISIKINILTIISITNIVLTVNNVAFLPQSAPACIHTVNIVFFHANLCCEHGRIICVVNSGRFIHVLMISSNSQQDRLCF